MIFLGFVCRRNFERRICSSSPMGEYV
jgi:hypothetical protein